MKSDVEQALFNAARELLTLLGRDLALARADYHDSVYKHSRVKEEWRRILAAHIKVAAAIDAARTIEKQREAEQKTRAA